MQAPTTRAWTALTVLWLLSASSCGNGVTGFEDGSLNDGAPAHEGASGEDPTSGDAASEAGRLPDGPPPEDAAAPPAAPFGVWTTTCTATPYPADTANAYPTAFQQAVADDWVYVAWVWRLSPDAATNHSVSAMKSKDMRTWVNLCGDPVQLPVTPASATVIDPVPINGGLLNSRLVLSFDGAKRPVISYHKNVDKQLADGSTRPTTQVFNARWEGSVGKIYQLTSWDSLHEFGGGGSLPASDTSVRFSGLRLGPSGVVAQTFNRSKADNDRCQAVESAGGVCSAFPRSGTWELQDSSAGLALRSPLTAVGGSMLASADPYVSPPTAALAAGPAENPPLSSDPAAAAWQVRTKMSRAESRWVTLRADFDGDGSNDPGLFDRYNSVFRVDAGTSTEVFRFGKRDGLLWPLTGDWNGDGLATIGVHSPITETTFLKNTLAGGVADVTLSGPVSSVPNIADSPLVWHPVNPAARYAIRWEALPANRDRPYDCQGIPLTTASGACQDAARMSSKLYLLAYDPVAATWNRSLIDQAWGGTAVGFDFVTFKNVQLVLYYGQDRQARIAQRVRQAGTWSGWTISTLASQFGGWDSHNYLTMTIDTNHNVHVSGNMHASPLVYFRGSGYLGGTAPLTYAKLSMTGHNEIATTYPVFLRSPAGELLFSYRSGSSGSGDSFVNRFDEQARTWAPLHQAASAALPIPLLKGK